MFRIPVPIQPIEQQVVIQLNDQSRSIPLKSYLVPIVGVSMVHESDKTLRIKHVEAIFLCRKESMNVPSNLASEVSKACSQVSSDTL